MFSLLARLRRRFGRAGQPFLELGTTVTPGNPYAESEFPLRYHATDHPLSCGIPDRADVTKWIDREIAKHSEANTLDEGTRNILAPELGAQHGQWVPAIGQYAGQRLRTAISLRNDQVDQVVKTGERLARARREVDRLDARERHFRGILDGGQVRLPPIDADTPRNQAASAGILPADVSGPTPLDTLLPSTGWPEHHHKSSAQGDVDLDSTIRDITTAPGHRDDEDDPGPLAAG